MILSYGAITSYSPPGTGDQGSLVIDIQDQIMDVHSVHWSGAVWDHFQIRRIAGDSIPALPLWGYLTLAAGLIVVGALVMRRQAA